MRVTVFFALIVLSYLACSNVASQAEQATSQPEPILLAVSDEMKPAIQETIQGIVAKQDELRALQSELQAYVNIIQKSKRDSIPAGYQFNGFSENLSQIQFAPVNQTQ